MGFSIVVKLKVERLLQTLRFSYNNQMAKCAMVTCGFMLQSEKNSPDEVVTTGFPDIEGRQR